MELIIVGVNHQTAPVALREKIAFTPEQLGPALKDLASKNSIEEVCILSTCNRTEIYAVAPPEQAGEIRTWLAAYHEASSDLLAASLYQHEGESALAHLMRVAAGLDSMILGEPQILGQLKDSFSTAADHNVMGQQLNRISQTTYRTAKAVRTQTSIGESTVSAASTAVDLAGQLFADLSTCRALLVGAGETIEIVARHLQNANVEQLVIANRTMRRAVSLATKLGGVATTLNDIPEQLHDADIVISSTASELPIIGKGMAERALKTRRHKPIFMVDLAVPRDIEPEVNELRDAYLYSIDDLQQIIADNLSTRQEAAVQAETIIQQAVADYRREDKSREATDVLVRFRQKHEAIKQSELDKALKRLEKGDAPEQVLTSLANQLTNKMMHQPSIEMKQAKVDGREDVLSVIGKLFNLHEQ